MFWVASEDHDFDEVSKTFVIGSDSSLTGITNLPTDSDKGLPVGLVRLDESVDNTLDTFFASIQHTEFTAETRSLFTGTWRSGMNFSDAFATLIARLFRDWGVVLIDPLNQQLKRLAAPIYSLAIERSREINDALISRGKELESDGFHAQVKVDESYFPLFWHDEDGRRQALKFTTRGTVVTKDKSREFKLEELRRIAQDNPQQFSPSVVLRPVVQDYLLPTICYFGGSAEIAYFAQNSVVYRHLNRPSTTILHRQSFTILEAASQRIMSALDVEFRDLFASSEKLKLNFAKEKLSEDAGRLFAEVEERINIELNRLDQHIASADPTISKNLANRRRKMLYHIAALRDKFYRSQAMKDETLVSRIDRLLTHVLPGGQLQERVLNIGYFFNSYGPNFTKWLYDSIDLNDRGHRVVYL